MAQKTMQFTQVDAWVTSLQGTYKSLPALPVGVKDFIVQITPWVALILGIVSVFAWGLLALISLLTSSLLALAGPTYLVKTLLVAVIALIEGVFMIMAFQKTKNREMAGWRLLTYVTLLGVVSSIVSLSIMSIVWGIIGAAIEFYFLFQIKSYYK